MGTVLTVRSSSDELRSAVRVPCSPSVPLAVHRSTGPPSAAEIVGLEVVPTSVHAGPAQLAAVQMLKRPEVPEGWNITAGAAPPG